MAQAAAASGNRDADVGLAKQVLAVSDDAGQGLLPPAGQVIKARQRIPAPEGIRTRVRRSREQAPRQPSGQMTVTGGRQRWAW